MRSIAMLGLGMLVACGGERVAGPSADGPPADGVLRRRERSAALVGAWDGAGSARKILRERDGGSPIVPFSFIECGGGGRLTITEQHERQLSGSFSDAPLPEGGFIAAIITCDTWVGGVVVSDLFQNATSVDTGRVLPNGRVRIVESLLGPGAFPAPTGATCILEATLSANGDTLSGVRVCRGLGLPVDPLRLRSTFVRQRI
jgi:hypothetical protein